MKKVKVLIDLVDIPIRNSKVKDKTWKSQIQCVQQEVVKIAQNEAKAQEVSGSKIDSQEKLEALVDDLNKSLSPINTSLRFGYDNSSEDFYVSVIEAQTDRLIRRFPAEQAQTLLPAMQELTGMLFDVKG